MNRTRRAGDDESPHESSPRGVGVGRGWELWRQPRILVGYVLGGELVVLAACVATVALTPPPTAPQLWYLALLAVAMTVHHRLARWAEERRRDVISGPHFNLTSVWTYAGVVLLPLPAALLLIALMRALTYPHARRALFRFLFGTAEMVASALLAGVLLDIVGRTVLMMSLGAVVYGVVQAVLVGAAIKLTDPATRWRDVVGSRADNEIEAVTLVSAIGLSVVLRTQLDRAPTAGMVVEVAIELLVLAVVVAVVNNRLDESYQRLQRLHEDNQRLVAQVAEQHQRQDLLAARAAEADIDHKTGLLNDRGWNRHAGATVEACREAGDGVAVLMVDLDHFKQINDTWGHATGDHVLKAVADILRNRIRGTDIVGRCGGEEFVALLPATNYPTAVSRAEEIRTAINRMTVTSYGKRRTPTVIANRSVSIGVAVYQREEVAADRPVPDLLDRMTSLADDAMYVAKATGRNRVCRADGVPINLPDVG